WGSLMGRLPAWPAAAAARATADRRLLQMAQRASMVAAARPEPTALSMAARRAPSVDKRVAVEARAPAGRPELVAPGREALVEARARAATRAAAAGPPEAPGEP